MGNGVLLAEANQRGSPNQDPRPSDSSIDLLVIHNISLPPREFGGPWIDDLFHNRLDPCAHPYFADIYDRKVSSHLLIRRDGELLQYVPLCQRAWHAGESCFEGRSRCNDFSIGIELEGADDIPYTDAQYRRLMTTTRKIMSLYPAVSGERIVGHSHIAPDRKTDPGPAFDWHRYLAALG
ncbi:MAG: 1,6-anhydro-N-acetylmuramyl-L-alanine amidase AmpD [Chromatiaceae bacterium]|nr:1,6-anhydro-N-acetylmuramyl-L-alanine amidase AmpD [Gammaproteobacteria bacterium]MCP5426787.1 1,6-anhydro-N-acetylmuramyl-L-alanine amidase AmpD [Chromatiaceae bacterium]MCB1860874.1 1,6-anhydro-N-acetylmuramyl-L-alanine amidase AmpD [Gammaproteobacteria bacterium]MCB1870892.1 1,6-anhydro-N-acetylmuramyl-L-alanine amidase AmpD [Gammaproteobacteria bacterium]MCB1879415.1 1,6-anhydro-N-acetylmuramyl-L-alanine amidase AmpD [Gammaproteobacteria bacterium]